MPHLDASALNTDQQGLDFLREVLGSAGDFPVDRHAFEPSRPTASAGVFMAESETERMSDRPEVAIA